MLSRKCISLFVNHLVSSKYIISCMNLVYCVHHTVISTLCIFRLGLYLKTNFVHVQGFIKCLMLDSEWISICFLVTILHRADMLVERLGTLCITGHARKWSRQYVCSLHFSEIDFTLEDVTSLDRWAIPNPSTVASHSSSAQYQLVWSWLSIWRI
jgi:hypothetical protein